MSWIYCALIVAAVALSTRYVFKTIIDNSNTSKTYKYPGNCRVVPGIECGSEKISVTSDGLAFITSRSCSNSRRSVLNQNGIYLFDFLNPDANVTKLTLIDSKLNPPSFQPLGMDLFEKEGTDVVILYVINHDKIFGESIEVFHYDRSTPNHLEHIKHINNNYFHHLNDITVVSEDEFYATNFWKYPHLYPYIVEYFLPFLQSGNILHYKKRNVSIVEDKGNLFNGLTLSENKQQLMVNMFGEGTVRFYTRHPSNGLLSFDYQLHVGYHPDNIHLDKTTGVLYVAALQNLFSFMLFKAGYLECCSSHGVKVRPLDGSSKELRYGNVEDILQTDGKDFVSGVSSVVHYKEQYLLGTVFHKLAYCGSGR